METQYNFLPYLWEHENFRVEIGQKEELGQPELSRDKRIKIPVEFQFF